MTRFEGFGPKVEKWFKGLEADNTKQYFGASREFFEESIRDQMDALLIELSERFGGEVKMFRQNRDIRFSPDGYCASSDIRSALIAARGRTPMQTSRY